MKSKWYFRVSNDWDFDLERPAFIDVDLLSFHCENDLKFICILGFSLIWERRRYAPVRNKI